MTDSECDDDEPTVFKFQNHHGTKFHVRGPHINSTVMSGLSFGQNNEIKSTMNGMNHLRVPTNLEHPRYAQSWASRSRRETSPMSITSASGMLSMNQYPGRGFGSQSVYGARGGSPSMSMRSFRTVDSNASAADIAKAIDNMNFNNCDLHMIKEALYRQMKIKKRRRVEKRRNARFTKIARRRISGDSGDRASDSSLSDDYKSVKSSRTYRSTASFQSSRTDFHKLNNCNMYKDSISNFQNSSHRSFYPSSRSCKDTLQKSYIPAYMEDRYSFTSQREIMDSDIMSQRNMYQIRSMTNNSKSNNSTSQNIQDIYKSKPSEVQNKTSTVTLEERFKSALPAQKTNMLPSQRFRQSNLRSLPSTSMHRQALQSKEQDISTARKDLQPIEEGKDSFDENYDIFGENTDIQELNQGKRKRNLNCEDATFPSKKKSKLSPKSTPSKPKDFVFAKPQLPISRLLKAKNVVKPPKSSPQKRVIKQKQKPETFIKSPDILNTDLQPVPEILISKCTQPLDYSTAPEASSKYTEQLVEINQDQSVVTQDTTNVSMKPSFMKRKLFSQKANMLDKNSSSDSIQSASPGTNMYSVINKEKHKTRKFVSSQSCLSRDFLGDDSNLLDLIHKIVPPDRMNLTSATNRTEIHSTITNKSRPTDNTLSVTTATKDGDISDTFTDEEIFAETITNEKSNNRTVINTKHNNDLVNVKGQQKYTNTDLKTQESNNKANVNTKHDHKLNERNDAAGNNEPTFKAKKDTPLKLNKTASVLFKKNTDTPLKNNCLGKNTTSKQKTMKQTSVQKEPIIKEKHKEMVDQTSMKQQQTEFRGFGPNRRRDVLHYWDSDLESDFELERCVPVWGHHKSQKIPQDKTSTAVENMKDAVANGEANVIRSAQNESSKTSENPQARVVISDNVLHLPTKNIVLKNSSKDQNRNYEIVNTNVTQNNPQVTIKSTSEKPQPRVVILDNVSLLTAKNSVVKNTTNDQNRNKETVKTDVSHNNPQDTINSNTKHVKKGKAIEKENVQPKNAPAIKLQQNKSVKNQYTSPKTQRNRINKNGKKSKVNNNTLRFKSQNQTKTDTLDESSDAHCLSLRSRKVDLSLNDSFSSNKTGKTLANNCKMESKTAKSHQKVDSNTVKAHDKVDSIKNNVGKAESKTSKNVSKNPKADISITNTSNKKTNKTVQNPIKNSRETGKTNAKKTVASKNNLKKLASNDQSVLSDLSFTLTGEITARKKSRKPEPTKTFQKTRVSNISFELLKQEPANAAIGTKGSQSNLSSRCETTTFDKSRRNKKDTIKPAPIALRGRTRSQCNNNRDDTITSNNKKSTSSKDITLKNASITPRSNTRTNSKANLNVSREVLTLLRMSPRFFATSSKRIPSKPRRFVAQD